MISYTHKNENYSYSHSLIGINLFSLFFVIKVILTKRLFKCIVYKWGIGQHLSYAAHFPEERERERVSVLSSKIWKNKLCNLQLGKRKINTPKPPTGGIKKVINHYQININSIYWIFCNGNSKISHWKNNCYCHNHLHQNKNSCFQKCMKTFHCIGEFIPCWGVLDYVSRFSSKDSSSQLGLYQLWITLAIATLT